MLRAAAVGGGSYLAGKRHAEREAQQPAPETAPAPSQGSGGLSPAAMEQLQQLAKLHEQGVLTDQELAEQKARILG